MTVKLTLTLTFPEMWGADEFWEDGKEAAIKDMIQEDQSAFVEDAIDYGTWKIEKT